MKRRREIKGNTPEIADLVRRLSEAEEALAAALSDQVDAIIDPVSAMPLLLRQAQEALAVSEARYDRLMTRLAAVIFELGPDGTILFVNDAVTAITGYTPADLQGRNWWTVLFRGGRAREAQALQRQLQTADVTGYKMTLTARDKSLVSLELNSANHYSSSGVLERVVGMGIDITQRMHAEHELQDYQLRLEELVEQRTNELEMTNQALLQEQETLRTLIDSITDEVWFCDAQGELALINAKVAQEFGIVPAQPDVSVQDFAASLEIFKAEGQPLPPEEIPLLRSLRGEVVLEQDEVLRHPRTGEMRHRLVNSAPLRARSGDIIGAVAVVRDVTRHKLAEQERADLLRREQAARAEAEQANAFKLRFLAMISHELRTPLTSIKGFTSTLLAPDVRWSPEQVQEYVEIIDAEADRLAELVEELLDVSRLQAGILSVSPEPLEFQTVLEAANSRLQAVTAEHDLRLDIPKELPMVQADPRRVAQVVINLVENAAKYSPAGTRISLSARGIEGAVQIDIADQGQGIPPEARETLFEPFRQLQQSPQPQKGAGLGLAICKGLVEAHGGKIWIQDQDQPGTGTTISFSLPRVEASGDGSGPK